MGKMKEISISVQEMLEEGYSVDEVVETLGVNRESVVELKRWMDFVEATQ
jgi:hypothetical protein